MLPEDENFFDRRSLRRLFLTSEDRDWLLLLPPLPWLSAGDSGRPASEDGRRLPEEPPLLLSLPVGIILSLMSLLRSRLSSGNCLFLATLFWLTAGMVTIKF